MGERHLANLYKKSFHFFSSSTNEKGVLIREIGGRIVSLRLSSILDIGAGSGDLAIPLSRMVERYVAIEQRPDYVKTLRNGKLQVVEGVFPCDVSGCFDVVLSSHSISWGREKMELFVREAIKRVAKGGVFLLVTYDNEEGDWARLVQSCFPRSTSRHNGRIEHLKTFLPKCGRCNGEVVETTIKTRSFKDFLEALAFVYSHGLETKYQEFIENRSIPNYLKGNYEKDGRFSFPFKNIIFEVYP